MSAQNSPSSNTSALESERQDVSGSTNISKPLLENDVMMTDNSSSSNNIIGGGGEFARGGNNDVNAIHPASSGGGREVASIGNRSLTSNSHPSTASGKDGSSNVLLGKDHKSTVIVLGSSTTSSPQINTRAGAASPDAYSPPASPLRSVMSKVGRVVTGAGSGPSDPNSLKRPESKAQIIELGSRETSNASIVGGGGGGMSSPRGTIGSQSRGSLYASRTSFPSASGAVGGGAAPPAVLSVDNNSLDHQPQQQQQQQGGVAGAAAGVKNLLVSVNFMQSYISAEAKVFCLVILFISLSGIAMSIALLVDAYETNRTETVNNPNSICHKVDYSVIHTSNVNFNLTNIMINCLFMMWFSFRSVRLEKEGLMICFGVVALIHFARSMYFCWGVLPGSSLEDGLAVATQVLLTSGDVLLVFASIVAVKVFRGFGYRTFMKGVTAKTHLAQLRRYKQLDTVVKLDTYMTFNTFVTLFFVVTDDALRVWGAVAAGVTLIALLLVPWTIKRRHAWFIYFFAFIAIILPAFYIYIVARTLSESGNSLCPGHLSTCLAKNDILLQASQNTLNSQGDSGATQQQTWFNPNATAEVTCVPGTTSAAVFPATATGNGNAVASPQLCWVANSCLSSNNANNANNNNNNSASSGSFLSSGGGGGASSSNTLSCVETTASNLIGCCNFFGRCNLKVEFRQHDQVLMVALAIVALVVRIAAVFLGFRQVKEMDLPGMKALLQRGERNAKNFSLFVPNAEFYEVSAQSGAAGGGSGNPQVMMTSSHNLHDAGGRQESTNSVGIPAGGTHSINSNSNGAGGGEASSFASPGGLGSPRVVKFQDE